MSRTMLRILAPLLPSIALGVGLLVGTAEPVHAQGFNSFGGMGGGRGRRDDQDNGKSIDRNIFNGNGANSSPKGPSKDAGPGGSAVGGGFSKRGGNEAYKIDPGMRGQGDKRSGNGGTKNAPGMGAEGASKNPRLGRSDPDTKAGGLFGKGSSKLGSKGELDTKGGRIPGRFGSKNDPTANGAGKNGTGQAGVEGSKGTSKFPWRPGRNPKGDGASPDQASTGGADSGSKFPGGKNPWPNRNPKDPKGGNPDGTASGTSGGSPAGPVATGGADGTPKFPGGKYPWPNRDPNGTKTDGRGSTGPVATGGGNCFDSTCPNTPPATGGTTTPTNPPPASGGNCFDSTCPGTQPPTGGGSNTPTNPLPTSGGDDGPGNPPCIRRGGCNGGDTPLPTSGGDDSPGNPPCIRRGGCNGGDTPLPTSGGDDSPGYPPCARRGGCDGEPPYQNPPRRPPIIVIAPGGPLIPPPDYGPPTYNPPAGPTPVYQPASPVRPRQPAPVRQVDRTPPSSPPPSALTAFAAPTPMRREFAAAAQPLYRPNELLVMVQGADPDVVAGQLAQSFNLTIQESQGFALLNDRRVYRFGIPDNRAVEGLVAAVANAPGVAQTWPNFYHYLQGAAGSGLSDLQYALPKLRVPDTQDLVSGRGVTVAVIDSGVDTEHPDLKRANIVFYDAVDGGVKDPDQHGTAITGIIAGKGDVSGIAPAVKILAIRAFAAERLGAAPTTTSMALSRAIDMAVARGARVVNMSFAGPQDPLILELIGAAYAKGVVFIAAAGNQGPTAPPAYPAAYEKVIGITATDEDDEIYTMANRGAYISIAAPGVDILAPVVGNGLDYMSGTSFAAAHITGIVALLMERNPKLGPEDVREILLDAAHDLGTEGRDEDFGAGLADAYSAVTLAAPKLQSSTSINP